MKVACCDETHHLGWGQYQDDKADLTGVLSPVLWSDQAADAHVSLLQGLQGTAAQERRAKGQLPPSGATLPSLRQRLPGKSWRDSLAVRSTGCPCKGAEFISLDPHGSLQRTRNSGICGMHMVYTQHPNTLKQKIRWDRGPASCFPTLETAVTVACEGQFLQGHEIPGLAPG